MPRVFSRARDPMSCYTHFWGACLSAVGIALILWRCLTRGVELPLILGGVIFGVSMLALYTASTIYHFYNGQCSRILLRLRKLDHSIIYLLIVGSYTPLVLRYFEPSRARIFLAVIWSVALGGIVLKLCWLSAPRWFSTGIYLLLGWAVAFDFGTFLAMPSGCLALIAAGGVCYSIGAVVYLLRRPNPTPMIGFHELFHLLILSGSLLHFIAIFRYVL